MIVAGYKFYDLHGYKYINFMTYKVISVKFYDLQGYKLKSL